MKHIIFYLSFLWCTTSYTTLYIPVSHGELIDKITILEIKAERINNSEQRTHVQTELQALTTIYTTLIPHEQVEELKQKLKIINMQLWDVEDALRIKEQLQIFDQQFIDLARSVYQLNGKRCDIKKALSILLHSAFIEQKLYHGCDKKI